MSDSKNDMCRFKHVIIGYSVIIVASVAISIILLVFSSVLPNTWNITHKLTVEVSKEVYQSIAIAILIICTFVASIGIIKSCISQFNKN